MTDTISEWEALRGAVRWISDMRNAGNADSIEALINTAGAQFDLSPKEEEFLNEFYNQAMT